MPWPAECPYKHLLLSHAKDGEEYGFILMLYEENPKTAASIYTKTKEQKMKQETKPEPVPHVHAAIISEWVKDTKRPMQCRVGDDGAWTECEHPHWHAGTQYRFKSRWFDMEQLWIANGKPKVEYKSLDSTWREQFPPWCDGTEYRFKEVSRHAALKAKWEAKGRPER